MPRTPENVVEADWLRILKIAAKWPDVGREGGTERLERILISGGPKYAERRVRRIDAVWRAGKLKRSGKPNLPWAVLGRSKFAPPDDHSGKLSARKETD